MKKFRLLYFFAVAFVAFVAINSCSKEDYVSANSTYTFSDIEILKSEFADIMKSSQYLAYINDMKVMAHNIKNLTPPLSDRRSFEGWIATELPKTGFSNAAAAMLAYDNLITSSENYYHRYNTFLEKLISLNEKDIEFVLGDSLIFTPVQAATSSCTEDCYNNCELEYSVAGAEYALEVHNIGQMPFHVRFSYMRVAQFNYMQALEGVSSNYSSCMGSC